MKNDIQRFLSQEKGKDVYFTTMIDLYGLSASFPAQLEAEKLRHMPEKRVEFLERAFANDMGDPRFIPYIQLHEFEAYLFCDPSQLASFYDQREQEIRALQAIADNYSTPEMIDDGVHSAPSKRIIAQIPDYGDAKPVVGPQVAEKIGLDVIRSKCPHFNAWLAWLELL